MKKVNIVYAAALVVLLTIVVGCGPKLPYKVIKLEGTITCDGEPVKNCSFFFLPDEGRSSAGLSDAEGHFVMAYTPRVSGVQVGQGHFYFVAGPAAPGTEPGTVTASMLAGKYPKGNDKLVYTFEKPDKNFELKLSLKDE